MTRRSSRTLDEKAIDPVSLGMLDQRVAGLARKCLEVGHGSGIGCQNLKRAAHGHLNDRFLGF